MSVPELDPIPALGPDSPPFLCFAQRSGRDEASIRLTGELDILTAARLTECLDAVLADARSVVVDLCELSFMDCAGLRVLVSAKARARQAGCRLSVVRGSRQVDRLLEVTGLQDLFETADALPLQAVVVRSDAPYAV